MKKKCPICGKLMDEMICPKCHKLTESINKHKTNPVPCQVEDFTGPKPSSAWLRRLKGIMNKFKTKTRGRSQVYLACLYNCEGNKDHWIYVGQTGLTVEERYRDHKNGHRASKWVTRYGIGLLKPYFKHLKEMSYEESKELEKKVYKKLKEAGFKVKGGH